MWLYQWLERGHPTCMATKDGLGQWLTPGEALQTDGDPALPSLDLSTENVVRHPDMSKSGLLQFHKHTPRSTRSMPN